MCIRACNKLVQSQWYAESIMAVITVLQHMNKISGV